MHIWAKRGFQTALVTGGMLMLGTGIASADESFNPDLPPSALDGSVSVPIRIDNNALGTPFGQQNLGGVNHDITVSPRDLAGATGGATPALPTSGLTSGLPTAGGMPPALTSTNGVAPLSTEALPAADQLTGALPTTGGLPTTDTLSEALPATGGLPSTQGLPTTGLPTTGLPTELPTELPATGGLAPVSGALPANPLTGLVPTDGVSPKAATAEGDLFRGNKIVGDLVVPIDISGNAIAILGDASVENSSDQTAHHGTPIVTDGSDSTLAGNVVALMWAAPVQITGNAVAVGGTADSYNTSSQSAAAEGDIVTDGEEGVLSGNVLAGHGATPVQLNGNAVSGGGIATTDSASYSEATSGGTIVTDGEESVLSGNAGAVPVAVPVQGNGNAVTLVGIADALTASDAYAQAGDAQSSDTYDEPAYIKTDGDEAVGSGNILQPALAGPVAVDCNAAAVVGIATTMCATSGDAVAGGSNLTNGEESVIGGAIGHAPVAIPTQATGNAGSLIGTAVTETTTDVSSDAGGSSYTGGDDSVGGGLAAVPAVTAPIDACGNTGAGGGQADATCIATSTSESGGFTGTTGNDSVVGGDAATVPVAVPVEGLANTVGVIGGTNSTVTETKTASAGGDSSTNDDAGVLASNLANVPVAGPVQAAGNGGGVVADTFAYSDTDSTVDAGGYSKAKGNGGTLAGNIAQAPVAIPTQVLSSGATVVGDGDQAGRNTVDSEAGDYAQTSGEDGSGTGNVVSVPVASAVQAFGDSAAVLGHNDAASHNTTMSDAGGTVDTNGDNGSLAGNVVAAQALPIVQAFGDAASAAGGMATGAATNDTDATSGGDITTSGDNANLSGNLLDVPAAAVVQPHGDAVAALFSDSIAASDSVTNGSVGGTSTTSGDMGSLSGIDGDLPIGVNAPIYDVPVEVLAEAMTFATNESNITVGEDTPQLDLPQAGGLEATTLPSMPRLGSLPMAGNARTGAADPISGLLGGLLGGGMLGGLGTDSLSGMTGGLGGAPSIQEPLAGDPLSGVSGVTGQLNGKKVNLPAPTAPKTTPRFAAPAMPGLDNLRGVFTGDLFQAPKLDKLPVQTPALAGLKTPVALPTAAAPRTGAPALPSLDDTKAKLAGVFGHFPIG
ncbi:Small secreted domain [Actinokineospora alba]|uniref:Small secreted domain n=1 Tax=Actinokineospora alba TaxID=504798 RepID=A0A1H0Q5D5_9PSEU|nr:chaplin family protein [Actinokineospora alba]TDP66087.1 small secreted domain DUF320 [Actinokineospora alba]SDI58404.1 Small secreted domain [Actinokineospora alba]SDP12583.1 Small secreted domain [Actinokineospora alba]